MSSTQVAVNHQTGPQKPNNRGKNHILGAEIPKGKRYTPYELHYPQKYSIGPSTMEIPNYLDKIILSNIV